MTTRRNNDDLLHLCGIVVLCFLSQVVIHFPTTHAWTTTINNVLNNNNKQSILRTNNDRLHLTTTSADDIQDVQENYPFQIKINKNADPSHRLQEYLDQKGITRFCEIGNTKYGRGLVATTNLQPGDIVLKIPLSEAIIVEETTSSSSLSSKDDDDAWAGMLALQLLERMASNIQINDNDETKKSFTTCGCPYVEALPPPPPTPARGDWSEYALQTLDNPDLLKEIQVAMEWREAQYEQLFLKDNKSNNNINNIFHRQLFFDALDIVSSRTIRCGSKFMLVPFLDMANHASRDQGGGYYELIKGSNDAGEEIVLKVDRNVQKGDEILLDYGSRKNEEWLLYYGFLPDRNTAAETVELPSKVSVGWSDVNNRRHDQQLKRECKDMLNKAETTLTQDISSLYQLEQLEERDRHLELALKYRIARKTLLNAVAGERTASAFSSVFLNFEEEEEEYQKADDSRMDMIMTQ
jgi:hypothetical protein